MTAPYWVTVLQRWQNRYRISDAELDGMLGVYRSGLIRKAKKRALSGGNISLNTLSKLAIIMKISPYRLLGGEGQEEKE